MLDLTFAGTVAMSPLTIIQIPWRFCQSGDLLSKARVSGFEDASVMG